MPDLAPPLFGRRILVVEDEYLIAMQVRRWLEEAGAIVIGPVPSVVQALDLIEDALPDAAMLDVNLGNGVTGYPVADTLRGVAVPYLFATGETGLFSASGGWEQPLLAKPYSKDDLLRTLTELLASPARTPEALSVGKPVELAVPGLRFPISATGREQRSRPDDANVGLSAGSRHSTLGSVAASASS